QAEDGDGGKLGAGGGVGGGHRGYRLSSRQGVQVSTGAGVRRSHRAGRRGRAPWAGTMGGRHGAGQNGQSDSRSLLNSSALNPRSSPAEPPTPTAPLAPSSSWNPSVLVSNFPVASAPAPAVTPALPPMVRPKNS